MWPLFLFCFHLLRLNSSDWTIYSTTIEKKIALESQKLRIQQLASFERRVHWIRISAKKKNSMIQVNGGGGDTSGSGSDSK